ncbi:putative glycolipid-binding domain-containing protein [Actinoplanes sp. NPDC051851]|uniref:putative glycolipid-binding domain-containing protein n=1 Tax=Actinoplanes sp. NPDC051851 TaxID=3154753 RepID=UPI003432AD73
MSVLPAGLFWARKDVPGSEYVRLSAKGGPHAGDTSRSEDRTGAGNGTGIGEGLYAQGSVVAAAPVGFVCEYELRTDPGWVTSRLDVRAQGAGWARAVRLELAAGRWRVTASEQGDLDSALVAAGHARAGQPGMEDPDLLYGAFDVDLGHSPLTNTLPIRRLGLLGSEGVAHRLSVAWVLVPSLEVVQADQIYTAIGENRVRYASETFSADLTLDDDGFVLDYPGLAERVGI